MFRSTLSIAALALLASACAPHSGNAGLQGTLNTGVPTTSGNQSANPKSPIVSPAGHEVGGVNGGGGDTLASDPIDPITLKDMIQSAKQSLMPYINDELLFFNPESADSGEMKVFGGKPNLYDIAVQTDIELKTDGPCEDQFGKSKEGSVHSSDPNAICISSYQLTKTLGRDRARAQVLGLILHELSHKLGTTEAEAVSLQKFFISSLESENPDQPKSGEVFATNLRKVSEDPLNDIDALWLNTSKLSDKDFEVKLESLQQHLSAFNMAIVSVPFSMMNAEEWSYFNLVANRIQIANQFELGLSNSYWNGELDKTFKGASQLTYADYLKNTDTPSLTHKIYFPNEIIKRPASVTEAKAIVEENARFLMAAFGRGAEYEFQSTPNRLPFPSTEPSPFVKFLGSYGFVSGKCDDPTRDRLQPETYTFALNDSKNVELMTLSNHGRDRDSKGEFVTGGSSHYGGSTMVVTGDANSAVRTQDSGNRWGARNGSDFEHQEMKWEQIPGGEVKVTESWFSRPWNHSQGGKPQGCITILKKTN